MSRLCALSQEEDIGVSAVTLDSAIEVDGHNTLCIGIHHHRGVEGRVVQDEELVEALCQLK